MGVTVSSASKFLHVRPIRRLPERLLASFESTLSEVTEACVELFDVERVGIWLFNPGHTEIVCRSLYMKSKKTAENPATVIRSSRIEPVRMCERGSTSVPTATLYGRHCACVTSHCAGNGK